MSRLLLVLVGSSAHPNWVGVWKTTSVGTGNVPVIRLDAAEDSLTDERTGRDRVNDYQMGWLVSGDNPDPSSAGSQNMVELVGGGSATDSVDYVKAPLESLTNSNGSESGAFAYWVSDESTKARVDLANRYKNQQPGGSDQDSEGYRRLLSPENYGVSSIDDLDGHDSIDDEDASRILSVGQGGLAGLDQNALKKNFHALTTSSLGIFTDTLRSGLRADLSVFIEEGSIPALSGLSGTGINENTPLLEGTRRSHIGPRMGILRSWAQLSDQAGSGNVPDIKPRGFESVVTADKYGKYPDLSKHTSQPIHPVIAHATVTTRMSYVRGYLAVHLYPRIVLWNPYNVNLEAQQYVIDFNHFVNDSLTVEKRTQSGTTDVGNFGYDTRAGTRTERRMVLTTVPTSFGPGEALVFSPVASGNAIGGNAMPLAFRSSGGSNMISASVDPHLYTNFYITLGVMSGVAKSDLPVYANHNRGAYYWVDMMDWWWNNDDNGLKVGLHLVDGNVGNYNSLTSGQGLLQLIDTDNWKRSYQGRFNNGRWKVGGVEPVYDYESTPQQSPWLRTSYGVRLKWLRETNPYNLSGGGSGAFWHAAHIANYNMRAALCHRSPYDMVCDNGESHHWYTYGPYAVDRQQSMPLTHPDYAAHPGPNGYRANLFFAGNETGPTHKYPLFDVPGRNYQVHSIGAFRHAQLSMHIWQPTYAVGSSRAPINLFQRERTAAPHSTMVGQWQADMPHIPAWMKMQHLTSSGASTDHFVYDLSYEANHALWDKYFLSSGDKSHKQRLLDDPLGDPLPNSRIVPLLGASEDILEDGRKAASKLAVKGPFNVNSTSKEAWKALLGSFKGLRIPQSSGAAPAASQDHPFPRFLHTPAAAYNGGGSKDVEAWAGYRKLSNSEIDELAEAIVQEVRERGPFVSISDFVNRRLVPSTSAGEKEHGLQGTLDAAIAATGINTSLMGGDAAMPQNLSGVSESYGVISRSNPAHFPQSKAEGAPGWLMQGDILQQVGSVLTARGDTFRVRAYGESRASNGRVMARAWCEAVVQRLPDYLDSEDSAELPAAFADGSENAALKQVNRKFGRRYVITSFRWLTPTEV